MADDFKYHIDHHASLVRPPGLTGLQDDVEHAIQDALVRQRRLGLLGLSDGEFRRRNDLAVLYDAVAGFGEPGAGSPTAELTGTVHAAEVRPVVGTLAATGRLVAAESAYLSTHTDRSTMLALPAPGYVSALADDADAGPVLAGVVRDEIGAVAADGVAYVLLRNPALGFLLRDEGRERARSLGLDPDKTVAAMVDSENAAVAGLQLPENFCLGLDLTTAGQATGSWDRTAVADFLSRQAFGRLCVDHPATATFPVELLPGGLVVSLGVVDVSTSVLEDVDDVVAAIDAAAAVIDVDDIAISTNGGFHAAPSATAQTERAKLQLVETAARYFWGNEL